MPDIKIHDTINLNRGINVTGKDTKHTCKAMGK